MTIRLAFSCLAVFAVAYVVCTEVAFRLIAGFNPQISLITALLPASLYLLLLLACAALASTMVVGPRVLLLAATMAFVLWVVGPFLLDLLLPKGSSFSINLGGKPVIVDGERTDFGWRLKNAQLISRIASATAIFVYLSLQHRKVTAT